MLNLYSCHLCDTEAITNYKSSKVLIVKCNLSTSEGIPQHPQTLGMSSKYQTCGTCGAMNSLSSLTSNFPQTLTLLTECKEIRIEDIVLHSVFKKYTYSLSTVLCFKEKTPFSTLYQKTVDGWFVNNNTNVKYSSDIARKIIQSNFCIQAFGCQKEEVIKMCYFKEIDHICDYNCLEVNQFPVTSNNVSNPKDIQI